MKRFNLISILILFFTFFGVQCLVAAEDGDGYFQEGTTWYTTKYTSEFNLGYNTNPKNLDINLKYPSNYVSFEVFSQLGATEGGNRTISIHQLKNSAKEWENIYTTPKIDNDKWLPYNTDKISPEAIQIAFVRNKGTLQRWIRNIKVRMAPHIIMKTESVDFMFNLSTEGDKTQKDVEFHSFLTAGPLEYSIVNKDNDEPNQNFTLHDTQKVESNTFSAIDNTTYNFKVSFNTSADFDGYYYARIKITDGTSTEYVNLSGYKYNLNLRWEQELPELTVDEPFTLIADTYDDNGGGPIGEEIYVTYECEPEDAFSIIYPENPKEAYPIIIPQRSCESATITAYKKGNKYYNPSDTIIKTIAKIKQAEQTLNWEDFELTTADKDITITGNLCQSTKADLLNRIDETITYTSSNPNVVEINNNTLTVHKYGEAVTITASQAGKVGYINPAESKSVTITPKIGTIQFDNNGGNGDNNWNTTTNWLPINTLNTQRNVGPSAVVNGVITAEAVISNAERNEINNLTFETGGKLTIGATSGLKANAVTNATADNLTLEASADGNATFIYNSGTPSATVEMYSKASGGVVGGTPEWQYMGVAVNKVDENNCAKASNFSGAWLLKWDETENPSGDPWSDEPLAAETTLMPWAGYSITQPEAKTYTMSGQLMNGNHEYELSYTPSDDPDCGFNLLANSYTAPIDITKLSEEEDFVNADACIILYNTGTYAEWEKEQGNSGEQAGQLTVIPIKTVGATDLPKTIPSMQAFFVRANSSNASFTVNYSTDVAGAEYKGNQMRAPRAEKEFNVLKIMIEGENTRDRLYLLENEETSEAYDNGYEARKIFDAPRGHQMYATCEYGYASIDCSESFVGQTIGLKGDNDGEMLTITFDTERLNDYESLYLYDKATGKYVNIIAGEEYTFFGIKGADDNRFSIVTNPDDENQTPPFVVIGEELAFDKSQIEADNANIYIYDRSGRLLIIDKINPYENYNIPNMPNGIYLVNMNGYTTKIVKK